MIREAYEEAATLFVETVGQVVPAQWERQALGEWNARDLVGHTNRALLTVETYLDNPAKTRDLEQPVSYFLRAMAALGDPAAVAARGRAAGQALGPRPLATIRETATRVLARLRQTPDETLLTTPVGGMRLIDYLPSRVFELTIHTLDLAAALSIPITTPSAAARVTFSLVTELAIAKGDSAPLLLSAVGRGPLPPGFSVL
jgi:uncharacterized protein (TIGR03083 family)